MGNTEQWEPFDQGATLGGKGSENGTILLDEEHIDGARITLEENGRHPFSITCGIYGLMVYTTFAALEKMNYLFWIVDDTS